jgi:hypothetical protein
VTASAEELDGYAPGASALILSGEDGQVQTMVEILEAIDRILVDAPIAYRELAAASAD